MEVRKKTKREKYLVYSYNPEGTGEFGNRGQVIVDVVMAMSATDACEIVDNGRPNVVVEGACRLCDHIYELAQVMAESDDMTDADWSTIDKEYGDHG